MITVRLNGDDSSLNVNGLNRISDIVELIKASIDPEHMITGILLNGRELEEDEWQANTSNFGTVILEVETGTPESYVEDRVSRAATVVKSCYLIFREARMSFQNGDMQEGNQKLVNAVHALHAFFDWFLTLTTLIPEERRAEFDLSEQAEIMAHVCKKITEQQLHQSWWGIGETIKNELEPKLDDLEAFCHNLAKKMEQQ